MSDFKGIKKNKNKKKGIAKRHKPKQGRMRTSAMHTQTLAEE